MNSISSCIAQFRMLTPNLYFERQESTLEHNGVCIYSTFLKMTIRVRGVPYTETYGFSTQATDEQICEVIGNMHESLCEEAADALGNHAGRMRDEANICNKAALDDEKEAKRLRRTT